MIAEIVRPRTVKEAVRARSEPGAAYLGGGTWLNSGRAEGTTILISLENLGLRKIDVLHGQCTLGAMVTFQQIVEAAETPSALRAAAALTASRTLRNMKTLGGELGLSPDDSALIPTLMALDAEVTVAGRKNPISVEDYLKEGSGDLVLSVTVPDASRPCAVRALSRTSHSPRSLVVAVCAHGPDAQLVEARVVASDCRGLRVRLREIALKDAQLPPKARIEKMVKASFAPAGDMHASGDYKRYMACVLAADALYMLFGKQAV